MTNSIAELEDTDCLLVIGSNTNENHPVIAARIKRAARLKNKDLIVIDPRKHGLVKFARLWLRQTPGTDIALVNGMMNLIIQEKLYDEAYVTERTEGFEALKETVAKYTPEYVEKITGVPADQMMAAARMYAKAKAASIVYCMGITQHSVGTDNVKTLANLAMLCGNVGIEGGGVNPLRGQNNVQGACDMGGLPNVFSGYQAVTDPANREKMEKAWGVKNLPDWVGMTMTDMLPAISKGGIKALYIMGENPALTDPDSDHAIKAMQSLDLLVVQDIFLTETGKLADVVLPASSFAEKDGTFSNTERRVSRVRQAIAAGGTKQTRLEDHLRDRQPPGLPHELRQSRGRLRGDSPGDARLRRHLLSASGSRRPAVALPQRGTPGHRLSPQGPFRQGQGHLLRHRP